MKTALISLFTLMSVGSAQASIPAVTEPLPQIDFARKAISSLVSVGSLLTIESVPAPSWTKDRCNPLAWKYLFAVGKQLTVTAEVTVSQVPYSSDEPPGYICRPDAHFTIQDQYPTDTAPIEAATISKATSAKTALVIAEAAGLASFDSIQIMQTIDWQKPSRLVYLVDGKSVSGTKFCVAVDALNAQRTDAFDCKK